MKRIIVLLAMSLACLLPSCRSGKEAPQIGISCGRSSTGATLLSTNYTDAVLRAGGVPVVFPTIASEKDAEALVASVDGIIFSGGPDLDPSWYGETIWNETVQVDTLRDTSDILLMKAALSSGKPVLGICRGAQLLNVVLGGTLIQDIPSQVDTLVKHSGGNWHPVSVEKGSFLYEIFGRDTLQVNSSHHQAVSRIAPDVRAAAYAPDGVLEAYAYGDRLIAVQFHPERMVLEDDDWLALFRYFLGMVWE